MFKKGDRIRLPPTLSQPSGYYRILEMDDQIARMIHEKTWVKRVERTADLPGLVERAAPPPTNPVSSEVFGHDTGVLANEGYHVGVTAGLPPNKRQMILRRVFEKAATDLRVQGDETYRAEWGEARSEKRLCKMIRCLDSFLELSLKRGTEYRRSRIDWLMDLDWLDKEIRAPNGFNCYSKWRD